MEPVHVADAAGRFPFRNPERGLGRSPARATTPCVPESTGEEFTSSRDPAPHLKISATFQPLGAELGFAEQHAAFDRKIRQLEQPDSRVLLRVEAPGIVHEGQWARQRRIIRAERPDERGVTTKRQGSTVQGHIFIFDIWM